MKHRVPIDWSVLSGPRVSRRTLMQVAAASGAAGYAAQLAHVGAAPIPRREARAIRQDVQQGGELRLGMNLGQIPTLDPAQVNLGDVAGKLLTNLFSGLVQFDEELGIVADLAEDWTVSEDGLEYTFNLRSGLTFHNGDSLTAEDLVYTYERTIDPDFASPQADKLSLIEEMTAQDETTLYLRQSAPYAPFLGTACSRGPGRALLPVSRRAIEEMGDQEFGAAPVGCGPFMIDPDTVEVGGGFEMLAFEDWYGGRPPLDKIILQLVSEPSTLISALEAGDVDMIDVLPPVGHDRIAAIDDITIVEAAGTNWYALAVNHSRPPWDNLDARMAVAKAIDRDELINTAFFGRAMPSIGPIAPAFGWVYQGADEADDPQAFNLEEAQQLAESAGLDGVQVNLISNPETRVREVLRSQLSEIGLDVQIEQMQQNAYVERRAASEFDMDILGSVVDVDPDDNIYSFFHSEGAFNFPMYSNPEADELADAQREVADQEERAQILQEFRLLVATDVAYAHLYHLPDVTAFYSRVQGYLPVPEQRYLEHVWLEE